MSRSIWKGFFSELTKLYPGKRIWSRRSIILPNYVGLRLNVHAGQKFIPLHISKEMIGHKFGEFAQTRKKPIHKKKRK